MAEAKKCFPKCEFFRCNQKAIRLKSNTVYCVFADDLCEAYNCKYAFCLRNRLISNGICGLTLKRSTNMVETSPEETVKGFKVKGRLQYKLKEKELY